MSDKISGFTIIFENSVNDEYMDLVQQSISLIKGVVKIERVVENSDDFIGQMQENSRIRDFLLNSLRNDFGRVKK